MRLPALCSWRVVVSVCCALAVACDDSINVQPPTVDAGSPPPAAPELACQVLSPVSGTLLTLADDSDLATPGVQVNVRVKAASAAGLVLSVGGLGDVTATPTPNGDGTVTFAGITLPAGPASTTLSCRVERAGAVVQGAASAVEVPGSCGLLFVSPAPGAVLRRTNTSSGPDGRPLYAVSVRVAGVEEGAPVTLEVGEGAAVYGRFSAALRDHVARFTVPVFESAGMRFFAKASGAHCETSDAVTVPVYLRAGQREATLSCGVSLSPTAGTSFNAADDGAPATAGLQTRLCVRSECPERAPVLLAVGSAAPLRAALVRGSACFDVTLPEGAVTVRASVGSGALTGSASAGYCSDLTAPTATLSRPATGHVFSVSDDLEPTSPDLLDIAVEGTTSGLAAPCPAANLGRVEVVVNGVVQRSVSPDAGGAFAARANLSPGANTVRVCAVDPAGNRGCSLPSEVTAQLPVAALEILSPASEARLLRAGDLDASTPLRELDVEVRANTLPLGTAVAVVVDGGRWVCSGLTEARGSDRVARVRIGAPGCAGLPDGPHTFVATAVDAADNLGRSRTVAVVVDNTPPTLAFSEPAAALVTGAESLDLALLTSAEERQVVTLQVPGGTRTETVRGGGVVFLDVPLREGDNAFSASVSDAAGNAAPLATLTVTRRSQPAVLSIAVPATGATLTAADDLDSDAGNGVQADVRVVVPNDGFAYPVALQVNGGAVRRLQAPGGLARFVAVSFAEGVNELVAVVVDAAGNAGRATRLVTVNTGSAAPVLESPADGATLLLRDDAAPAQDGFQVRVRLRVAGPIERCEVALDRGSPTATRVPLQRISASACEGLVTLTEGAHTLIGSVRAAGRDGVTRPSELVVRGTDLASGGDVPSAIFNERGPLVFNADSSDESGRTGFQAGFTVSTRFTSPGDEVFLTVTSVVDAAATATYREVVAAENGAVRFANVTLFEPGESLLRVVARTAAGVESTPDVVSAGVWRARPAVKIVSPEAGRHFGVADDLGLGAGFSTRVVVHVGLASSDRIVTLTASEPNTGALLASETRYARGSEPEADFSLFTVPVTGRASVVLTAQAADDFGNQQSDSITVDVDLDGGGLTWFTPGPTPSPVVLCPAQDVDLLQPGIQVDVVLRTSGLQPGTAVTVNDAAGNLVGSGTVAQRVANVRISLPVGEATFVLGAQATRPSGNAARTPDSRTFRVDTVGPLIRAFACSGDQNGDGFLNKAENSSPTLSDRFEMTCTVTFDDASMNGRSVSILSSAPAAATVVGTAVVTGTTATIPVALLAADTPLAHTLMVSAADGCSNAARVATGVAVSYSATVDVRAPVVAITAPVAGLLLVANDKLPAPPRQNGLALECCTGPSGAYDITASVAGAVTGTGTLRLNGVAKAVSAVASGLVRFANIALDNGTLALAVEVTDGAGNVGVSAPVVVTVDALPPTLSIQSPTAGQQLATNQVTVNVAYSDVEVARSVEIRRRNAGSNGTGAFSVAGAGATTAAGTLAVQTVLPQGQHELQAVVSDVNGNASSSPVVTIDVTASSPIVFFETPAANPAVFNLASGAVTQNQLTTTIIAQTGALVGSTAVLLKNGAPLAGAIPVPVVDVGGVRKVTFAGVLLAGGEVGNLQVRITTSTGDFSSLVVPFSVDLAAPTLSFSTPACKAALSAADADPSTPGSFRFTLSTDAENGQTVSVSADTVPGLVATGVVNGGTATTGLLALPAGLALLTATVLDRAGNEQVVVCATDVDVTAPAITDLALSRSLTQRNTAVISWTMPGDNGRVGTVAGYELVWRSCDLGTACTLSSPTEFSAATAVPGRPALSPGGTPMSVQLTVPLQKVVVVAMRATDDAGNLSPIASATVTTSFADDTFAGPAAETEFGGSLRSADVDGDGVGDLLIGRPAVGTNGGALRIAYGALSGTARTATDVTAAQLGLTGTTRLGRSIESAGDVDGDGFEDVIVGAPGVANALCTAGTGAQTGAAFLFFGGPNGLRVGVGGPVPCTAGGSADCYVALSPPAAAGVDQVCSFGQGVAGLGNVSTTGAGRSFVAVGAGDATVTSTRVGRVFLYSITGTRPNLTVNLVSTLIGGATDYHFGAAVCGVRDVTGDGIADLVVGAHRRGQNPLVSGRAYLFLGGSRFAATGGTVTVTASGASTSDGVVPIEPLQLGDSFGNACQAAGDLDGDGLNDFVVTASASPMLGFYAVRGRADLDAVPPTSPATGLIGVTLPGFLQPGEIAAGFDLDGDGRPDVVLGDTTTVYVFGGDATNVINTTPIARFTGLSPTVSTGYPVAVVRNWKNTVVGESALPDIAIGRLNGPVVGLRY